MTATKLLPDLVRLKSFYPSAQHSRLHGSRLFRVLLGRSYSGLEQFSHDVCSVAGLLMLNKATAPAPKTTASMIERAL